MLESQKWSYGTLEDLGLHIFYGKGNQNDCLRREYSVYKAMIKKTMVRDRVLHIKLRSRFDTF